MLDVYSSPLNTLERPLVGLSSSWDKKKITLTSPTTVISQSIDNLKETTRKWSLPNAESPFTAAATTHPAGYMVAVQSHNIVSYWKSSSKKLSSANRKSYMDDGDIFSVLTNETLRDYIVVVHVNGNLSILNVTNGDSSPGVEFEKSGKVVWASSQEVDKTGFIFVVFHNATDNTYTFNVFTIYPNSLSTIVALSGSHVLPSPSKAQLLTCSFELSNRVLALFWSNGTLDIMQFMFQDLLTRGPMTKVISRDLKIFKLPTTNSDVAVGDNENGDGEKKQKKRKTTDDDNNNNATVVALFVEPSLLALIGREDVPDGKNIITIWNTTYGSMHAKQLVSDDNDSDYVTYVAGLKGAFSTQFVCAVGNKVTLHRLHGNVRATLSNALGRLKDTAPALRNTHDTSSLSYTECGDLRKILKRIGDEDVHKWHDAMETTIDASDISKLLDKSATPTSKEFKKIFDKHVITLDPTSKKPQLNNRLQPNIILQIAKRCVESKFWKPLLVLIDSECVSLSMVPNLLDTAMEENLLEIIVSCVRHQRDISDQYIVKLIQYFLNADRKSLVKVVANIKNVSESSVDEQTALHLLLDTVFAFKRENLFIYNCLKALTLNEIKEILEYLYSWLNGYSQTCDVSFIPESLGNRIVVLPYKSVLNWFAMLIDVHYTQLIFAKELHPLINNIKKKVDEESKLCLKMGLLSGYLAQLEFPQKRQQILSERSNRRGSLSENFPTTPSKTNNTDIGAYAIEVLIV